MQNKLIGLMLGAAALLGSGKPPAFTITANVKGSTDGKKVYLAYADKKYEVIDSTTVQKGRVVFKGSLTSPRFLTLIFQEPEVPGRGAQDRRLNLFAENSAITIDAVYDSLKMGWQLSGGTLLSPATIKGSASHQLFLQYQDGRSPYEKERSAIFDQYIRFLNSGKEKRKNQYRDGIELCRRMDAVDSTRRAWVLKFIQDRAPGEVTAFIAKQATGIGSITVNEITALEQHFSAAPKGFQQQEFTKAADLAKKTAVGSSLLDLTLEDKEGGKRQLSEFIGKGRYVLLEFWASWCGPCRADIPHLKDAYERYHSKGFDVVGISLDESKEKWTTAIGQEGLDGGYWPQLVDQQAFNGELAKSYRISGIPACLLFDPEGKLVTRNMRGSWMDGKLIDLYGDLFGK